MLLTSILIDFYNHVQNTIRKKKNPLNTEQKL